MPEISLNAYENEIDQLIEQARYLEALAHIRHVLGQYPHYLEAYYLLGKVMLEIDLPELAVDMFRRALSADPEHMMARIGLALAHERANNLDASIWNLERALELDPSNNDISDEVRRMYGRRDGVEPEHITQTRAGLARLYIRGDRPGRAVIELRKLLADSPARPDLLTALAEAHWRDGQLVQAAEVSQEILDKMPYNCKANLLLGSLWVNSGQDAGWAYLNRAQDVDLANTMATTLFGADSLLEHRDVTFDRLVYDPDVIEVDQGSAWFKRLASASVTMGISEAPPEMTESELRLVDITAGLESQIEIPDWLRELGTGEGGEEAGGLGWMADAGLSDEDEADSAGAYDGEAADQFGSQRAFDEADTDVDVDDLTASDEEMPDWLQELTTQEMAFDLDESEQAPDWLMELVGEEAAPDEGDEAAPAPSASADRIPAEPSEASDWLTELATDAEVAEAPVEASETAMEFEEEPEDWLSELQAAATEAAGEAPDDDAAIVEEELPDWLSELEPAEESVAEAPAGAPDTVIEAEDAETPDWLSELQTTTIEAADEGLAEEGVPDWLSELEPAEESVAEVPAEAPAGAPDTVIEAEDAETPDWLSELELAEESVAEALAEAPDTSIEAEDAEDEPDWLSELERATEVDTSSVDTDVAMTDTSPLAEPSASPDKEVADWLQSFDLEGAEEAEVPAVDADAFDEADLDKDALDEVIAEVAEEEEAEESWLRTLLAAETPTMQSVMDSPEIEPLIDEPLIDEALTGEAALAWLDSLTVGTEAETSLEMPEGEAAPTEIEAEVETVVEEPLEAEEAPPVEAEQVEAVVADELAPEAEPEGAPLAEADEPADLLSGDDALSWLESLAAGKEDELRAQAEVESEARVAEILGRRRPQAAEVASDEAPQVEVAQEEASREEVAQESAPQVEVVQEEGPPVLEPSVPADADDTLIDTASAPVALDEAGADELLSGDDALSWLESLAAGKEDELRAQANAESEARIAEILGRKPAVSRPEVEDVAAVPEVTEPVEIEREVAPSPTPLDEAEATVVEEPAPGEAIEQIAPEGAVAEESVAPPSVAEDREDGGELLSGDDALSWLESLTAGKEDELRAQAEAESRERVAEILGRKRAAPPAEDLAGEPEATEPEPTEPAFAEGPADTVVEAEVEPEVMEPEPVESVLAEEPDDTVVEAEIKPEVIEPELAEPVLAEEPGGTAPEAYLEPEPVAETEGEDARAWLESLAPDVQADLDAQLAADSEPAGEAQRGAGYFGWSAFGEAPQEVPVAGPAPWEDAPVADAEEILDGAPKELASTDVSPAEGGVEPVAEGPEPTPEPDKADTLSSEPAEVSSVADVVEPEADRVEPEAPPEVESTPVAEEPERAGEEKAGASTPPEAPRPEAEPSEATADELDEMREYVKKKRSDHTARLTLARALWEAGEVQESMQHYGRLIKSSAKTEELLADLEAYADSEAVQSNVMRTLGDAYMKFGDLDKALDIYNRAMDML